MFIFKKIVSQFLMPLPLCLSITFTGLGLLWWSRHQKAGKLIITFGLFLVTALSYAGVADALLGPLERKFPSYAAGNLPPAKFVVVLGCGYNSDRTLPLSSQLTEESLKRLVEGIRVFHDNPGSKLILSGGNWLGGQSEAVVLAEMAKQLGVRAEDLLLEVQSRDTEDEVRLLGPMVTTNEFILVTSARHLPRSMRLFRDAGLNPRPAPAAHMVARSEGPGLFFPNAGSLKRAEVAFYEWLGSAWLSLRRAGKEEPRVL